MKRIYEYEDLLTNALVHADYTKNASLNIYKYPNKIVFSNPGIMLISIKQYYQGGESICRNKYLQTMFTFLGSAEKAGSGVDKILRGWEELKWKRPYIIENKRPNKVVLTLLMESLKDSNMALNMDTSDANVALNMDTFGANVALNMDTSVANIALPDTNVALPDANVALPKRYNKKQLKEKMMEVCSDWITVDVIAAKIGRDVNYVKNHVLPQLADVLEKMYDVPHHPRQKYRVKQKEADV